MLDALGAWLRPAGRQLTIVANDFSAGSTASASLLALGLASAWGLVYALALGRPASGSSSLWRMYSPSAWVWLPWVYSSL